MVSEAQTYKMVQIMGVGKRNNTWYAIILLEQAKTVSEYGKLSAPGRGDAVARYSKVMAAKREGKFFDIKKEKPRHTFDELLEKYKEAYRGQKSYNTKKTHFPVLIEHFAGRLISEITTWDLINFRNKRKDTPITFQNPFTPPRQRSVASVNRCLSALRHMLSQAVEWGMLGENPFSKAKNLFYKEHNRLRFLKREEAKKLLLCCAEHLRPIVVVALNTGMRRGEILTLKWSQIRDGFIYLSKTKTDTPRQIPLNNTLTTLFESLPRKSNYVFCNKNGKPYTDIKRSFNSAVKKAGIDDFHFHDLRRTFASNLVMKGVCLKAVAELLGHKSLKMIMVYAHLSEEYKKSAVELLDED